jgi:hypothetical protein
MTVGRRQGTHQIPRSRCGPSLDLSHISRTSRPSSLASGPSSFSVSADPGGVGDDDADMGSGGGGGTSMDSPRQPAFWRFAGIGVGRGDSLGVCERTLAVKSASYRARVVCACCFAPGADVGVEADADTEAREDMDVREVVVPCEKSDERSEVVVAVDWTDVRADGGRERGRGAFVVGIATAAAAADGGGGGGTRRVLWRETEELLAEGVRVTGEPTPEVTGEGEEL